MPPAVRIRAIRPADAPALEAFYAGLEPDTLRARFFAVSRGISAGQATRFCGTDHEHREGLVAVETPPGGGPRIVGHLCLEPLGADALELGIAVEEDVQGQGIGRRLMLAGAAWARRHGYGHLCATTLATNDALRGLLTHLGLPATLAPGEPGETEITVDLVPSAA